MTLDLLQLYRWLELSSWEDNEYLYSYRTISGHGIGILCRQYRSTGIARKEDFTIALFTNTTPESGAKGKLGGSDYNWWRGKQWCRGNINMNDGEILGSRVSRFRSCI